MGTLLWLAAGALSFTLARFMPPGRGGWRGELALSLATSFVLGVFATALDFGGWKEPDWRAVLFAALGSLAAIALLRAWRLR